MNTLWEKSVCVFPLLTVFALLPSYTRETLHGPLIRARPLIPTHRWRPWAAGQGAEPSTFPFASTGVVLRPSRRAHGVTPGPCPTLGLP